MYVAGMGAGAGAVGAAWPDVRGAASGPRGALLLQMEVQGRIVKCRTFMRLIERG